MTSQHTFAEAFELLLKIQAPKSKNTFAQAKCVVDNQLTPFFAHMDLSEFERSYEELWAEFRTENAKNVSMRKGEPRRLGHARRYLVMALKRANAKGWVTRSFTKKDFALNEVNEEIGRALSDDEVNRLLKALEVHPKTRLQVLISLTMGMRYSEVLKLRVDEVDLSKRVINLDAARLKTRRRRKVPIPISNAVFMQLSEYVTFAKGIYVFPMDRSPNEAQSDNRHWWTAARSASQVQCRFHDLRHTWATNMIARGTPQDYIIKVGGFTQQVMSRIYSHMNPEAQEDFRSAFDGRFETKKPLEKLKKRVFQTLRF